MSMKLGKAGWLSELLQEAVQSHAPERVRPVEGVPDRASARVRARRLLKQRERESGLMFGTPRESKSAARGAPEQALCRAVLQHFAELALDVSVIVEAPPGPRQQQLLVLFASSVGLFDEANEIARLITPPAQRKVPRRLWSKVEAALEERASALVGGPAYGLVLHNGIAYIDATVLGRTAIDYFVRQRFVRRSAERRVAIGVALKETMVELLTAIVRVEGPPTWPTRRAILRQIDELRLPSTRTRALRARVRRVFERRPPVRRIVEGVRAASTRRLLFAQAVLAAEVEGRTGPGERRVLEALAESLGFGRGAVGPMIAEVTVLYAHHRATLDVFTQSAEAGIVGDEVVDAVQGSLEKTYERLMQEVRETGELSVLLARAARGQKLTSDERARMRAQLADLARVIPALAIFAAPGGLFLLIALAKVLPFSLLPSAFRDEPETEREKLG